MLTNLVIQKKRLILVYPYNRNLISNKKGKTTDIRDNIGESQKHYTKLKKPEKRVCMCDPRKNKSIVW